MASVIRKGNPVKTVTLKIPASLYDHLAKTIEGTGFRSVTEFAIHVLRDVATGGKFSDNDQDIPKRVTNQVVDRLKSLGYID
jgi:hypothetical protein